MCSVRQEEHHGAGAGSASTGGDPAPAAPRPRAGRPRAHAARRMAPQPLGQTLYRAPAPQLGRLGTQPTPAA